MGRASRYTPVPSFTTSDGARLAVICVKVHFMPQTSDQVPPAPPGFDYELLARGATHWHQRWQVFRGVYTPGGNPVEEMLNAMQVPADLTRKRVLDVGSWNGCASFECERRRAA